MKNFAILTLVTCSLGVAQTQPDLQLPPNVRLYEPKNLTPDRAEGVAGFVRNFLNLPGLFVGWDNVPHAFVIRNGKPQDMDMAEALLRRYDVPEPKVELTIYLIRATSSTSPAAAGTLTNPIPAELKSAIDEMKASFNYERYTLWDTIVLEAKGSGEIQGILPVDQNSRPYEYTVSYSTFGPPTERRTLYLAPFQFSIKQSKDIESHIKTEVRINEGQKSVLGRIRLLLGANADLFLILTTKVH